MADKTLKSLIFPGLTDTYVVPRIANGTAGHLASLDGAGNATDSGRTPADFGSAKTVEILFRLAKGQLYDTQTDSTAAYQKTVPSGAVAVEIGSIGGKTIVWNQLVDNDTTAVTAISGRKYLTIIDGVSEIVTGDGTDFSVTGGTDMIFNLTRMFPGDEPSTTSDPRIPGIIAYAEAHPEFDDGSLLSAAVTSVVSKDADAETLGTLEIPAALLAFLADKDYGASAGSVYNEIDWAAKTYTQRVKSFDMGSLSYTRYTDFGDNPYFSTYPGRPKTTTNNIVSEIYSLSSYHTLSAFGDNAPDLSISANAGANNDDSGRLLIRDDRYATASALKAALAGVLLYMEIATPEVYDISEYLPDDNMLDTEPGGTLTFVQEDTAFPVPNSVDYLVKLSEVTP